MRTRYDVAIIGGGPGGYVAAIKSAQHGKSTLLIEQDQLGGVCLNWGCIPTKSLLHDAKHPHDYAKAQKRSRLVNAKLVQGVGFLMQKNGVDILQERAEFSGPGSIVTPSGNVTADAIIIAAGSRPAHFPGIDYSSAYVLDSKKALQLTHAPQSAVIIGAGAIGMEFASIWTSFGSEVTIVEMQARLLPGEDKDISHEAEKLYARSGIKIRTATRLEGVDIRHAGVRVRLSGGETLDAEYILVAGGICPNTQNIGLERIGVTTDSREYIMVDNYMRTRAPGIYAIGDITGKLALAHAASAQAEIAVSHICGRKCTPLDYTSMPKCTYGLIETASAGLTEAQARGKYKDVMTGMFPFSANGKALASENADGFIKVVAEQEYNQLLGVHMIGPAVSEMIFGAAAFLRLECTLDELSGIVFPHPSASEAFLEAVLDALGKAIHK